MVAHDHENRAAAQVCHSKIGDGMMHIGNQLVPGTELRLLGKRLCE
jgi:hypothetical protein